MNKQTLGLFVLAFSSMASATTVTWTLSGPNADFTPCCSHTFTSDIGGLTITAYGFTGPGTTPNAFLYGKNAAPDDIGLGLDLTNDPSHEITRTGFVQLDISGLVGKVSDFMFMMSSVSGSDGWAVLGSNTLGTPSVFLTCSATKPCPAGSMDEAKHTILPSPVGLYKYVTFEATAGTFLLNSVSANTVPMISGVPEPASLALMGVGLLGFGVLGRRLKRSK